MKTQVRTETPKGHLEAHKLESEAGLSGFSSLGKPPRPWLGLGRCGGGAWESCWQGQSTKGTKLVDGPRLRPSFLGAIDDETGAHAPPVHAAVLGHQWERHQGSCFPPWMSHLLQPPPFL